MINSIANNQTMSLYTNHTNLSKADKSEEVASQNNDSFSSLNMLDKMNESIEKDLDRQEFDNFIKEVRGEFDDKDIDNLIKYQDQGTALEEAGDMEAAQKIWDKFDAILEKYDALGDDESKDYLSMNESQNSISSKTADTLLESLQKLNSSSLSQLISLGKDDLTNMSYKDFLQQLQNAETSVSQNQPLGNRLDLSA